MTQPKMERLPAHHFAPHVYVRLREVCRAPDGTLNPSFNCGHVNHMTAKQVAQRKCAVCSKVIGWEQTHAFFIGEAVYHGSCYAKGLEIAKPELYR